MGKIYACIDLKSFYASCECVERHLDPLITNLVVADIGRTEKTICLAVTPALKSYGIAGRARLYEVIEKVKNINEIRKKKIDSEFIGKSYNSFELNNNKRLSLDFIIAPPRMSLYMKYSTKIYEIYLKYLSEEDIYVYSIDEVFCDFTNYLKYYKKSAQELVTEILSDVYKETGITATAGIGTNLYLAKVAMDILAKHSEPNEFGVRIAELDELEYRKKLWLHEPLTDFWRIGVGTSNRLKKYGIYNMGDIAKKSIDDEDLLYKIFGINAELIIDHAWGYEPCTIDDIKNYVPKSTSISQGQVLSCPYDFKKAKLITREMIELLTLDLVKKNCITDCLTLTIGYDVDNLKNKYIKSLYDGEITLDHYGRYVPKSSHGTIRIDHKTSSTKVITEHLMKLYDKIVNHLLLIRRINISACNLRENNTKDKIIYKQFDLFTDIENEDKKIKTNKKQENIENKVQNVLLEIKNKYGKNAILKGMNLEDGATTIERNKQIGGHRSE